MSRLLFITALALFFAVPLWARRGGGHATFGGGHAGGFSGHGFSGGGHVSAGMRSGFSHRPSHSYNRGFSRRPYSQNGYRNGFHNGFHGRFHDHGRFHNHDGFASNCFGFGCWGYGFPWWGAYYDPWLWDWSNDDARFDADYNDNLALANEMNEQSLEQQRMLRQEEADGDQDVYARSSRSS